MRQRLPPRDRQQPGLDARLATKAVDAPIRPQEHVLRDVFGLFALSDDSPRRANDDVLVTIDQDAKRRLVACPGALDQLRVGH